MASFINRIFNNVFSFFPWHLNPTKRYRDDSSENEENNDLGITPSKKQKIHRGSSGLKILGELNTQPTVTTVRPSVPTKLQLTEDSFQPSFFKSSRQPMPLNSWVGAARLDNNGRPPKHVSSPVKARKHRMATLSSSASIDLTKEDDDREELEQSRIPCVDLTRSQRVVQVTRRSLANPQARSTPDSFLDDSNSSEEFLKEDDDSSDVSFDEEINMDSVHNGRGHTIVKNYNLPDNFVDLTDPEDHYSSSSEKKAVLGNSSENGDRRRRNSLPLKSTLNRSRQFSLRRFNGSLEGGSLGPKTIASIDLTGTNNNSRRKRSASSLSSHDISVIDLKECISYGKVIGSMLQAHKISPPKISPNPVLGGTIDLTGEDDDIKEVTTVPSTSQREKETNAKTPVVEKAEEPAASISSSTQREMKKEILKVNSFQEKIKDIPCNQEEWVKKLIKEYNDTQEEFNSTRNYFMQEALKWSQVNYKDVETILEEKISRHLRITEAALPVAPEDPYAPIIVPLPELTKAMEAKVKAAFTRHPENEVLIKKFSLPITRKDIQTLNNLNWLNDEVINFYMQLLEERCQRLEKYPSVHTFSTFFYIGLQRRGHEGMKRWTKKVNIFEKDIIIVPIHLHVHWCLVVVDLKKKEINYYDSMGNSNDECLQHMKKYLVAEHKVKMEEELDLTDWKIRNVKDIPQQMNGSDCGVFACTYAEFSSRRAPFSFDQSKMQYFRRKMTYEIITGELL